MNFETIERERERLLKRLDDLDRRERDYRTHYDELEFLADAPEGTVIRFSRKFERSGRWYTYVAVRVEGRWYLSGEFALQGTLASWLTSGYARNIEVRNIEVAGKWKAVSDA